MTGNRTEVGPMFRVRKSIFSRFYTNNTPTPTGLIRIYTTVPNCGRRGDLMVSGLDSGANGPGPSYVIFEKTFGKLPKHGVRTVEEEEMGNVLLRAIGH